MSPTQQILEGTWEEIARYGEQLAASQQVRLIILAQGENGGGTTGPAGSQRQTMISRGMFPQLQELTDDDFRAAEFHGDSDDALDAP